MYRYLIRDLKRFASLSFLFLLSASTFLLKGQELNCTVKVNHSQVQGTNNDVFKSLEADITEFMNNRLWTDLQYQKAERIDCTMTLQSRHMMLKLIGSLVSCSFKSRGLCIIPTIAPLFFPCVTQSSFFYTWNKTHLIST